MDTEERHERHHTHLAEMAERIARIEQHAYERAKTMHVHAPRKFARRAAHSQRVTQVAAWRSHLVGLHGVKRLGPFVELAEMQRMHDEMHKETTS